jgi:proton glutamate symport protein
MSRVGALLKNPWTILLSIALGVVFGLWAKDAALLLAPLGEMYLFLIQMCVMPILVTAVVSSLANIIKNKEAKKYLGKTLLVFAATLVFLSLAGAVTGVLGQPGNGLDGATKKTLGQIINKDGQQGVLEMTLKAADNEAPAPRPSVLELLKTIVPSNIFNALGLGQALEVVFFSIIFGIVLGFIRDQNSRLIIHFSQSLLEAFQKLISWALYGLPFGLIFLISSQVAQVGVEIFVAMFKFVALFYLAGLIIFLLSTLVIWAMSGVKNPVRILQALLDPIIISFATRNSFAALPASIESLEKGLRFDPVVTNLVLSLGTTVCRFGNILYFALASYFVAQIYGVPLGLPEFLMIVIGSVLAGTATAGASGLLTLPMIGFVLSPLGLPVEAILVIFIAIDTFIDPMRTFIIVYVNVAATVLVAPKARDES